MMHKIYQKISFIPIIIKNFQLSKIGIRVQLMHNSIVHSPEQRVAGMGGDTMDVNKARSNFGTAVLSAQ